MNKKRKITFVINNLDSGGAEKVLVNILNNLDRNKFQPKVFLFERYGSYLSELKDDIKIGYGIEDNLLKGKSNFIQKINKIINYILRSTLGVKKLEKFIEEDEVVVAFLEKMVTYNVARVIKKKNKKSYAWLHTNIAGFSKLNKKLSHKYYKFYDGIICVSEECANLAKSELDEYRDKIYVEYNPIEISLILKKAYENVEYKLPNGINILAIGRLTNDKGFDILIKSFDIIENKDCNLIILGEGEERSKLEKIIKELNLENRVFLPGFVKNPFAILKNADLFVLSSRREGLPSVLIEALALEKKIVSTICSGASEILENGKYGELAKVENISDLANKINECMYKNKKQDLKKRALFFDKKNVMKSIEERLY